MAQTWGYTRARREHAALIAAIVAVLAAGIVSAILITIVPDGRAARENGSLLAPPSDEGFTAAFGAPGVPSSFIGAEDASAQPGGEQPAPAPRKPAPKPGPGTPPPPPDEGPLGLLDDIPILPPFELPGLVSARALERVAAVR